MSSLNIDGYTFKSRTALKNYLSVELRKLKPNQVVEDPQLSKILTALFYVRSEKVEQLGDGKILNWEIEPNNDYQCFAVRVSETERIHMSFHKAIKLYWEKYGGSK